MTSQNNLCQKLGAEARHEIERKAAAARMSQHFEAMHDAASGNQLRLALRWFAVSLLIATIAIGLAAKAYAKTTRTLEISHQIRGLDHE